MGRLLEALKRLELELPAARPTVPIALPECPAIAATDADRTAVMEPPATWGEEYPTVGDLFDGEYPPAATACEAVRAAPAEVNRIDGKIEKKSGFFPDPQVVESQPESRIEDDRADREPVASAEESASRPYAEVTAEFENLVQLLDGELPLFEEFVPKADAVPLGFLERTEAETEPCAFFGAPESDKNSLFAVDKPEAKRERGAFGAMARNVLAQLPGEGPAALFFTSPTDGEGKTETILPLAEALIEESGRRTILVDANLHRPDLTREWRFTSRKGIFDVLAGEADWWEAVQETGLPKLSILLNNGLSPRQGIISRPLAFSELLENLQREYRLVLIDAASLAHDETIPMLRYCRGVYLVVRLGHSSPRTVREARQVIARAGGNLLGCIAVGDVLVPASAE
ncbi:MAG: CpsD/CapB family tyrosine-protein kinase [Pirellulales bacterium]|nr:CpsD/CapB family tyrosine-protein kinase [Pirellulales bacterium]